MRRPRASPVSGSHNSTAPSMPTSKAVVGFHIDPNDKNSDSTVLTPRWPLIACLLKVLGFELRDLLTRHLFPFPPGDEKSRTPCGHVRTQVMSILTIISLAHCIV